jgi:hypothetical protein
MQSTRNPADLGKEAHPMNKTEPEIISGEVFGQRADFFVERQLNQDGSVTVRLTTILPRLTVRDGVLCSFKPPRFPWDGVPCA